MWKTQPKQPYRFAGSLYQLFSKGRLRAGDYVEVNGPHDTYGVVWKSEEQPDGTFLNLIRGIPPREHLPPVASF